MKLIIKEYLTLLKESKELDVLIPELLLSMDHQVIIKPQKGLREFGVDVLSVGNDIDGNETVFIFTIKQGDITRKDWIGSEQSLFASLIEIKDIYIPKMLDTKYKDLPKKIIVSTGGDLKSNVQLNWNTFKDEYKIDKKIEFEFWGGDILSPLIEEYLFNEYVVPKSLRSKFRKTLSLLDDTDYNLRDFYEFLYEILDQSNLETKSDKERLKALRLIYLTLNIIHTWSIEENNLKHSLLASERALLNVWGFIQKYNYTGKKKLIEIVGKMYFHYFNVLGEYCEKIAPLMEVENGMSHHGQDFIQESIIQFEQLGILSLFGILFEFSAIRNQSEIDFQSSKGTSQLLMRYIKNHKSLYNPVYDSHIIDISLAIFLLVEWGEIEFLDEWIYNILSHIEFAYSVYEKYYPIDTNSFDDLVDINVSDIKTKKEDYIQTSTLIPILAQWCIKLGLIENYKYIQQISEDTYKDSTLQIWYPDKDLEDHMYDKNAGYHCGYVEAPIELPKQAKELAKQLDLVHESGNVIEINDLSCVKSGIAPLILISNRHFRMPFLPHFWNTKQNKES